MLFERKRRKTQQKWHNLKHSKTLSCLDRDRAAESDRNHMKSLLLLYQQEELQKMQI